MLKRLDLGVIKRGLILFWALWITVVTVTNILNAAQAMGIIGPSFKFISGNWQWIGQTMNPLGVPHWLQATMFAGVIIWEGIVAILYWWAVRAYRHRPLAQERVLIAAMAANLALWAAFQILDEAFLAYNPEAVHRVLFTNQLLTILVLAILPQGIRAVAETP